MTKKCGQEKTAICFLRKKGLRLFSALLALTLVLSLAPVREAFTAPEGSAEEEEILRDAGESGEGNGTDPAPAGDAAPPAAAQGGSGAGSDAGSGSGTEETRPAAPAGTDDAGGVKEPGTVPAAPSGGNTPQEGGAPADGQPGAPAGTDGGDG